MALLDVNALVALAWDTHVHHEAVAAWFDERGAPWATCPVSEAGFVRVPSNPKALPGALSVEQARSVLRDLREVGEHRFLINDVSLTDRRRRPDLGRRLGRVLLLRVELRQVQRGLRRLR